MTARPDPADDRPLRILVLGDFGGTAASSTGAERQEIVKRSLAAVDIDNFDQVLARHAPTLCLSSGEVVVFKSLDDFHPDRLVERLDLFQSLRELRRRLRDPATFPAAAAELRQASSNEANDDAAAKTQAAEPTAESDGDLFSRLLGAPARKAPTSSTEAKAGVDLSKLIRDVVQPHIVPEAAADQQQLVASVDQAIAAEMRGVLHDPSFQALEAKWRGVSWLLNELEFGEDLQLCLLDVTRDELQQDLSAASNDLTASGLYQRVVAQEANPDGGRPWSLIVGLYTFSHGEADSGLLAALGAVASQAGGPFIAAASPRVLGCQSLVESPDPKDWTATAEDDARAWTALRQSPVARWLGLALPRVLLRLPYGERTDEVEHFAFEEMISPPEHDHYLWGNPALACAWLLGQSFLQRGWSMEPGDLLEIGDLPAHSYESQGEVELQPCAEVRLTERAAEAMTACGLMPLMSFKNRNAVRLFRFQSLADPPGPLSGPWN